MQPKDSQNALANRRHLFLTTADFDRTYSDRWSRCIITPTITEEFQYMSLISATVPNTISTIQNEVNDHILFHFEWYECKDPDKWLDPDQHEGPKYKDVDFQIVQNNYTGKELMKLLGDKILSITWKDITDEDPKLQPGEDPSHITPFQKIDDQTDIVKFVESGENRLQINFKYMTHCGYKYFAKYTIEFPNLAYKLYGVDNDDKEIQICNYNKAMASTLPDFRGVIVALPSQPSLIWVTFIQLRSDWVNRDKNSMVLANIPVTDINKEYITFTNPQVEWTTKKMQYHEYQRMKIWLSNEDGYAIDLKNMPVYFEVILY